MPETLEDKLVVGISSRALFDLAEANAVFEQQGLSAYREFQRQHEHETLGPGTAYPLVRGLLAVNERAREQLVEVIIVSRNDGDSAMRVLRSIEAHGLDITRGVFRGGRDPWQLLDALSCDAFLSAEPSQVRAAHDQGLPAALILPGATEADRDDIDEVRIAFDGDAVLFDAESQRVYDVEGLDAFHAYEKQHADVPLSPGPFRPFLDGLARIQAHFGGSAPVRTALVTSRGAPAHIRVVNTLRAWGVGVDETYFLGGVDKADALAAFGAHIFFDDQRSHVESASRRVPAAQVLWSEDDVPAAPASAAVVIKVPRASGRRRSAPPQPALGLEEVNPGAAAPPADPAAPTRSGR
jgi:5'-nucleotidase